MKNQDALSHATSVAKLLLEGAQRVGRKHLSDLSLFGMMSIQLAKAKAREGDLEGAINSFDPAIHEIILFGSTAKGDDEPGDVDLMVFDRGFYSNVLDFEPAEKASLARDWYSHLRNNLATMVHGWMEMDHPDVNAILDVGPVDLHVLPLALFHNELARRQIARKHSDDQFFQNAFACIKRFDPGRGEFVDTDLAYLERKYATPAATSSSTH